ncbi:hypothetical protein NL676_023764 [Syzygium grande]|nr:hypothetical protein NL676_023764 [Syzygium grande]
MLGSMHLMHGLAHCKLAATARHQAKRLMAFNLGETRTVVTFDLDGAREILNSSAFIDRPMKESTYSLMFAQAIGSPPTVDTGKCSIESQLGTSSPCGTWVEAIKDRVDSGVGEANLRALLPRARAPRRLQKSITITEYE